jgi:fumarylacetoacetate (FAA) hydrolase
VQVDGPGCHFSQYRVRAGAILGSGTVSNKSVDVNSKPSTELMKFGDTIRIEMKGQNGESLFGAIEQDIVPLNQA